MITLPAAGVRSGRVDIFNLRLEPTIILSRTIALVLIWRRRAVTRRQLLALERSRLADLDLAPDQVRSEAGKPFWRA